MVSILVNRSLPHYPDVSLTQARAAALTGGARGRMGHRRLVVTCTASGRSPGGGCFTIDGVAADSVTHLVSVV